jgi:subtilisin family serine protease
MEMEMEYTVLRDLTRAVPTDPFGRAGPSAVGELAETTAAPHVARITLDKAELRALVREPDVRAIAPVMPIRLLRPVPSSELAGVGEASGRSGPTWGVTAVGADASARTGAGVTVAVLDTGIDATHPAFAGVELIQKDFSGSGGGDTDGHGTHCAGTIFGRDVDGTRIGVAPGVTHALIGKVIGDDGTGASTALFEGMQWAVQQGADVISMSLGFDFPGLVEELVKDGWPADLATSAALEGYRANLRMFDALMGYVRASAPFGRGSVLVAAAGNESKRDIDPRYEIAVSIPAAAEGVVSVGALGESNGGFMIAPFSNTFPMVAAPGVAVLSAQAGSSGLVAFNGTSMATPHVAGVLALWWEEVLASSLPHTASTVTAHLLAGTDIGGLASDVDVADRGAGLVKAP